MTNSATTDAAARLRRFFAFVALAAAALTFVVIVASAFMRHTQAGLSCADWPACYGANPTATTDVVPSALVRAVRIAHRLAATGVLALIVGMLLIAWTQKPAWKRAGTLALVALALAIGLAVLGIATPGARMPAVTLGNLLGGYLMFAALCALVALSRDAAIAISSHGYAAATLLLVLVEAALGASIGAQYALTACPTLPACAAPDGGSMPIDAVNPFRPLSVVDGHALAPADAAGLHVVHRAAGLVVVLVTLGLAYRLRRDDRRTALVLAVLAIAAPVLGAAAIAAMPSLPSTVLHNVATTLLVGTLAAATMRWPVIR